MGTAFIGGVGGNTEVTYTWLCEDCWAEGDESFLFGSVATESARCSRCGGPHPSYAADEACNDPRPARGGWQMEFSTSTEVVTWPSYVWDVNGYYAELGVSPRADRLEIRKAYQAQGGQASPRLTYIVKQLLDPEIRRRYDAAELGSVFIDEYVMRWITQQMADDARQERIEARERGEVLEEDEFEKIDLSHLVNRSFDTVVDRAAPEGHAGRAPAAHGGWGFYRWRTGVTDFDRVSRWRGLLCSVATERGEKQTLAVGIASGLKSPVEAIEVGYRIVVFLSDDEQPNEVLAHEALDRVQTITTK